MVRTQVQFTGQQIDALRRLSAETGDSIAELVRQGMEEYLTKHPQPSREELIQRALRAMGKGSSGCKDISRNHDRYLAEIYGQ